MILNIIKQVIMFLGIVLIVIGTVIGFIMHNTEYGLKITTFGITLFFIGVILDLLI